jgi:hypothetical protein
MFNSKTKKAAIARLEDACARYEETAREIGENASALHRLRLETSEQVVGEADRYYSALANRPLAFGKAIGGFRIAFEQFRQTVEQARRDSEQAAKVSGSVAAAGVAAGVGVAALGPAAAMAIATTFGTASTGTAIATLSGAAATNAALAWLGGGAVVAGGSGMAAGEALLAMAGPVGWGIGLVAFGGAAWYMADKNAEIAAEASAKAEQVESRIRALDAVGAKIDHLIAVTNRLAGAALETIELLKREAPADYRLFTAEQKKVLGALKNKIESLSALLLTTVEA